MREKYFFPLFLFRVSCYTIVVLLRTFPRAVQIPKVAYPGQGASKHHDTPNNKTHVIKFRVTAEEKASLELTCKLLNLSLSTFIRRAIHNVKIEKTVIVADGGEETLTAVSTLLAQCSKVGTNLNQLARHFNSGGADTEQIRAKLLDELADLTAFQLQAEKGYVHILSILEKLRE